MMTFASFAVSLLIIAGAARYIAYELRRPLAQYPACEDDALFDRMVERAAFAPVRRQTTIRRPVRVPTQRRSPSLGAAA